MKSPKVSVIIPVHNAEKTLGRCLESVRGQAFTDFEALIVDNNSTDKTKDMISEFQKKDPRIKYLFEPALSRGAARNTGESAARGEIILMTDSDCIAPSDWIGRMIEPLADGEYEAVQGFQDNASDDFWSRCEQIFLSEKYEDVDKDEAAWIVGKLDTKNFAIKSASLLKVGLSSRKYVSGHDTELSIRLAKNNCKVRFLQDVGVRHFHWNSLGQIIKKQLYRAGWAAVITRDNMDFLKTTPFLKQTAQEAGSFFKIRKLCRALTRHGLGYAFYIVVTGLFWRLGLIMKSRKSRDRHFL
ncbi:MAG: glycosyltransferase [Candidatus Omnitrophica bacterium]|nr:glycosyltransferase [Candidatus Omnitrophota bacterium]